jgi:membrane fusion protein (multidrug efflux system)
MALKRKKATLGIIAIVAVIALASAGYVAKDRLASSDTADAADSTAVDDSTAVADGEKAGDKDKEGEKKTPPVPVEVAQVERREISSYYVTTATLEPEKKVDILAKISNEVAEIRVEEGDRVKKGHVLCRLDDEEQRVALDHARINREQKKNDHDRIEEMYKQSLISEKEYLDSRYQYELAVNAYEAATLRYEYTRIRAPFDGIITERLVDEGENITIGARLFVMADTDPLRLTMYLPEGEIKTVRGGQVVFIVPDANPSMSFTGAVVRIAPEVDQRTGTVKVTAETRGGGIPGSFVRVKIVTDTRSSTLAVPRRGVVSDAGDRFVFITEADTVRKVEVAVGYEDENFAEILTGLEEGDSVVLAGSGGVRTGTKIKIVGREDDVEAAIDTVRNDS